MSRSLLKTFNDLGVQPPEPCSKCAPNDIVKERREGTGPGVLPKWPGLVKASPFLPSSAIDRVDAAQLSNFVCVMKAESSQPAESAV